MPTYCCLARKLDAELQATARPFHDAIENDCNPNDNANRSFAPHGSVGSASALGQPRRQCVKDSWLIEAKVRHHRR
eukprot:5354676-Karenia_brevis.AAC.1